MNLEWLETDETEKIKEAVLKKHKEKSDENGYTTSPFTLLQYLHANGFLNMRKLKKAYYKGALDTDE